MKKVVGLIIAIFSSTVIISGCDYGNVENEAINVKKLESAIHAKLDGSINPKKDIKILDLNNDGKKEYIVKYKIKDKENPLRIMILSEKNGKPVIQDEIKSVGEEFDEVKYIDINNNGKLEIIAGYKAGDSLSKGLNIYEYKDGKVVELFEGYYSKYMMRKSKDDKKIDVVIIKEKEKDEKSYAYLYRRQGYGFENIKKVEIDPTLNTENEIFDKLLEK